MAAACSPPFPECVRVLPMRIIRENVRFNRNEVPCQVIGTLPVYTEVVGVDILRGRFLTQIDELHQNNVCVDHRRPGPAAL